MDVSSQHPIYQRGAAFFRHSGGSQFPEPCGLNLYRGQFDFTNFTTQEHDFNLAIHPYPDGLFWTVRIPDELVSVHLGAGTASMHFTDQAVLDFGRISNALANGPSVAATVSYDLEWSGVQQRSQIRDDAQGYAGQFMLTDATINWTAHAANGFSFTSDTAGQSTVFAQLGQERNGVFFP